MKVAVQVLDGKLLIHGYFEGSLVHPVRIPIVTFLAEHGPLAEAFQEESSEVRARKPKPMMTATSLELLVRRRGKLRLKGVSFQDRSRSPKSKDCRGLHFKRLYGVG